MCVLTSINAAIPQGRLRNRLFKVPNRTPSKDLIGFFDVQLQQPRFMRRGAVMSVEPLTRPVLEQFVDYGRHRLIGGGMRPEIKSRAGGVRSSPSSSISKPSPQCGAECQIAAQGIKHMLPWSGRVLVPDCDAFPGS